MATWRVLVTAPYAMPVIEMYQQRLGREDCDVIVADVNERMSEAALLPLVVDIDGVICGDDQFTERVLLAAPRLKVVSKWGTGIDSIDRAAADRLGIRVCNTLGAFRDPVADTVMGYVLMFARQFVEMDRDIRDMGWRKPQLRALREMTLGVVGVGNCGKSLVRRAVAFGMRVLGTDPVTAPADFIDSTNIEMTSLDSLLLDSDVVSLNCDLNPTSFRLIGAAQLQAMKRSAYLINTSRGPVVDESALARALSTGTIAGAALDVFVEEPLPATSPLRALQNCWLAPHNANSSVEAAARVHENTIRNLMQALREVKRDAPTSSLDA